jgi:hypothetical protein
VGSSKWICGFAATPFGRTGLAASHAVDIIAGWHDGRVSSFGFTSASYESSQSEFTTTISSVFVIDISTHAATNRICAELARCGQRDVESIKSRLSLCQYDSFIRSLVIVIVDVIIIVLVTVAKPTCTSLRVAASLVERSWLPRQFGSKQWQWFRQQQPTSAPASF